MITANPIPAAHAGEAQASRSSGAPSAQCDDAVAQLLLAAKTLVNDHLQKQRDDIRACDSAEHHHAVRALWAAVKACDVAGLSDACAVAMAADSAPQRDPRVRDMFENGGAA